VAEEHIDEVLRVLVDIDQVIHAPARLTVLTYLYVVESVDFRFLKNERTSTACSRCWMTCQTDV
jgi:hypothetical protein